MLSSMQAQPSQPSGSKTGARIWPCFALKHEKRTSHAALPPSPAAISADEAATRQGKAAERDSEFLGSRREGGAGAGGGTGGGPPRLLGRRGRAGQQLTACNMELESLNVERAPEAQEEEEEDEDRSCGVSIHCNNFHDAVSKWMLPEDARATYLERANCIPPPIFILAISVAELAVFIYYAVRKPQKQWITLDTGIWESPLIYMPDKRKEAWRFLSYMLVHAGIEHILGNLVLQLLLGIPLELVHKGHRVGLVYIAGVIGGSLASSICDPLHNLVGASGGVYALIGGYFMNILVNFREMVPLFGVARLLFIFSIVGTDVGFALYRRFLSPVTGLQLPDFWTKVPIYVYDKSGEHP